MFSRRALLLPALATALIAAGPRTGHGAEPVPVVASFSILGDMVREVGGDRVSVSTLVGPGGDAHVYEPSPADARAVAHAKVVFVNGLGFEGWMTRLIKASGFKGRPVVVSRGVTTLKSDEGAGADAAAAAGKAPAGTAAGHGHDDADPHAWQNLANGRIYVGNIAAALAKADPAGAATYRANAARYIGEIDQLERTVKAAVAALPAERRRVVTSHDAFGYFATAYGLAFIAPVGVSTEAEPTAADVGRLIRQIKDQKIPAVFVESITDPRLVQRIAAETGAKVGGRLYSDSLSAADGPAPTYLAMIRHNIRTLAAALGD